MFRLSLVFWWVLFSKLLLGVMKTRGFSMFFKGDSKRTKPWDCKREDFIDCHKTWGKIWSTGAVQDWAQAIKE